MGIKEKIRSLIPPMPWQVEARAGQVVSVFSKSEAREEGGVQVRETISQVSIDSNLAKEEGPLAIAQAGGVQHSKGKKIVFEANSAFSKIKGEYGSSASGSIGTPTIKKEKA